MSTGNDRKTKNTKDALISDEAALILYAALLATWISGLLWASLSSHLPSIPRFFAWDKMQHFFAYAVLMLFSGNFFKALIKNHAKGLTLGFTFTVAFGLLMEIGQQTLTTSRNADWKDFLANTLGASMIFIFALLKRK